MNQALVEHDAKRAEIVGHLQALDDAHRAAKQALGRLTLPSTLRDVLVVGAKLPDGKEYATTLAKAARLNQLGLVTMVPGLAGRQKYIKITPAGRDLIA